MTPKMKTLLLIAAAFGCALPGTTLRAEVSLAPLFRDGAVLQQGKPIPVWAESTFPSLTHIPLDSYAQISQLGAELKKHAKEKSHSAYVIDRRRAG